MVHFQIKELEQFAKYLLYIRHRFWWFTLVPSYFVQTDHFVPAYALGYSHAEGLTGNPANFMGCVCYTYNALPAGQWSQSTEQAWRFQP